MKALYSNPGRYPRRQRGLTLVELMITMLIALFLLAGLVVMVQNTRQTYTNQNALSQLQDNERLAMTLLTDVIQAAGYYPDPVHNDENSANPAAAGAGTVPALLAGQYIMGVQSGVAPGDSITVRYMTASPAAGQTDGIINCHGTSNTTGANVTYTNSFNVGAADAS
jgi:type IV pilus assembly protein PilW